MKVLVDMNLSPGWVDYLAGEGIEAVHWSNVGVGDASDQEVMLWAAERGHVVLTADLDFGAILAAMHRLRPSVVQVRAENLAVSAIGAIVAAAIRRAGPELDGGAIISVDPVRARVRVLPLDD